MKFRNRPMTEPEINLIPFIDVLLVILIFLMLSTTYSKFAQLQISLPEADAPAQTTQPQEVIVVIGADGRYRVNQTELGSTRVEDLVDTLQLQALTSDTVLVIAADANARHQSIINAMEAARHLGLSKITFTAKK